MAQSVIDTDKARMTHRERFRRLMHFQTVDRGVHWEFGYLQETIDRWHGEGLPAWQVRGEGRNSIEEYFGVDPQGRIPVHHGLIPGFEGDVKILEDRGYRRIEEYPDGTILEIKVEGVHTIPHYIRFPIANRDDWKRFKERLNPDDPRRYEIDYRKLNEEIRHTAEPVAISLGSFYGVARNWIGFEQISVMLYDDPDLVEEIIETQTQVYERTLERALREVEVDYAGGWEDICFRNGPMISPAMFKSLVAPRIKRVCDLLRSHGVDVIWTDCDGNINDLVPIWLDCGLNCMFPLEVQGGTDPVQLREEYGHRILLRGGVNKHRLSKGKKEIIAELKRIEKVVADGGYIPGVDHRTPEDVSLDNYKYYIREKLVMLGWAKDEIETVEGLK